MQGVWSRKSQVRSAVVAVVVVTTGLLGAPAQAHTGRYTPGAPGIGDPYFPLAGNGGYDVRHYDLQVRYDPPTDVLTGTATISARATQNLSRFDLDFVGMRLRSLTVNGKPATWMRNGQELVVTPARGIPKHSVFRVVARYDGVPVPFVIHITPTFSIPSGFLHTDDGAVIAGQPDVAASWFPVNDHPLDKATYDFTITAPAGLQVLANGRQVGHPSTRGNWTTHRWRAPDPMASYLATMAIGKFDVRSYRTNSGLRVVDAVDPDLTAEETAIANGSLGRQGEIVDYLSSVFGRYPWRDLGGIVPDYPDLFFALETQTRPVYSRYFFTDPVAGDLVVVHELAHQWYGDSVALARWQDIWLNEGFATYAEWLWLGHDGIAPTQQVAQDVYDSIPADDPFWDLVIGDPGPVQLFDNPVYLRGGMTLEALRRTVGDRAFFTILRSWATRNANGHGTTPEFIALAERVSGRQLDALFDTWLFSPGKPTTLGQASAAAAAVAAPTTETTTASASKKLVERMRQLGKRPALK
jgi:aminopeptidase N